MADDHVQITGLADAARDLERFADQLPEQVYRRTKTLADRVSGQVRGAVPVVSGALKGSVRSGGDDRGLVVEMGAGLAYAGWIEFGGARGRPYLPEGRYLFPAADAATDEWATAAEKATEDIISSFPWHQQSSS